MRGILAATAAALLALAVGTAEAQTGRWATAGDPNTMDPHSPNAGSVAVQTNITIPHAANHQPDAAGPA